MFVSADALKNGAVESYGIRKKVEAVRNTRNIGKPDMKFNGATPHMKVDPETFVSHLISGSHFVTRECPGLNIYVGGSCKQRRVRSPRYDSPAACSAVLYELEGQKMQSLTAATRNVTVGMTETRNKSAVVHHTSQLCILTLGELSGMPVE